MYTKTTGVTTRSGITYDLTAAMSAAQSMSRRRTGASAGELDAEAREHCYQEGSSRSKDVYGQG